jgi:hypothetical protein
MRHDPEEGALVLADISGFTEFVTATEIEHAPPIIAELLEAVIGRISPPLEIQEVEGDAVFALGPDRVLGSRQSLLDVLESAAAAFRRRRRSWPRTRAAGARPAGAWARSTSRSWRTTGDSFATRSGAGARPQGWT